jgi:hypothetical protein
MSDHIPDATKMINNGGPAFPVPSLAVGSGMTLRDYFAAAALQGCLASFESTGTRDAYASVAYEYADAMLKAKEAKP